MKSSVQVLVFIDLVQDLDVLLPVIDTIIATPGLKARVVATRWLADRAPRLAAALRLRGIGLDYVARSAVLAGRAPVFKGADALLTASETTASPHRWGFAAVQRANAAGIATFSLQHGLDNLQRLSRAEPRTDFASRVMFCWPPEEAWPALDPAVRARLTSVGRPTPALQPRAPDFDVGVFENLHSRDYDDAQREVFWTALLATLQARSASRFYVRSHPAGGWLDGRADALNRFANVVFVTSRESRRAAEYGCEAVIRAARVITTPSTVALDAAMAGRPVALALDGGALYAPLPVLDGEHAWSAFVDAPLSTPDAQRDFIARHVLPGDAAGRIVAHLNGLGNSSARS